MSEGVLAAVDSRTQLVGKNRLEVLLFRLHNEQLYAMNVFKIQEVMSVPILTKLPESHPNILGVSHIRGHTIPVIDLGLAIGMQSLAKDPNAVLVIAEYYGTVQGFVVGSVERIVNIAWKEVHPPPHGVGKEHYLTATTKLEENIVEVIDVEKVLAEIVMPDISSATDVINREIDTKDFNVLVVDDSGFARRHVKSVLNQLDVQVTLANSGADALRLLKKEAHQDKIDVTKKYALMITDAEMPEMDGYTLTVECRSDPLIKDLRIILHTSLSGAFNESMVEKVGCDGFIPKLNPEAILRVTQDRIKEMIDAGINPLEA
ncbi:chemotaxis protein [Piscirickettsia litoralis]|uniref:Chemotaxis protein CheW n=1 Tax=Piscirickettsia litoralis TaxID=1891921 RepID=A0ABX3A4X2_9GAMM|nr:chemotaxis protein [Piscirickettsia litoralis]ODN43473.1 chemotaxis protein CheW [Piscirickettsia litoralis]